MKSAHAAEGLVVIFANASFDGIRRSAKALAEALSRHVRVMYVDPTSSSIGGDGSIELHPKMRQIAKGLYHLPAVAIPGHTRFGVRALARSAVIASVRGAIAELGVDQPMAVMLQTPWADVLGRFGESISVFWATDAFSSGSRLMGLNRKRVLAGEGSAAAEADVVVAVSERLAETWRARGMKVVVIPHGVDVPALVDEKAPKDLDLPRPIAGVFGTLSERLNFSLLERVADSRLSIVLIGPASFRIDRTPFDRLCARDNVEWLGSKDHADLPRYYQHIDVGLVPYTLSEFNMDSAPLKPLEYLARGLPVVSTSLPGVMAIGSQDISLADEPTAFAAAVEAAAEVGDDTMLVERRRSHVSGRSWDTRSLELLSVLGHRPSADRS